MSYKLKFIYNNIDGIIIIKFLGVKMKKFILFITIISSLNIINAVKYTENQTASSKGEELKNDIQFWVARFHDHLNYLKASPLGNSDWNQKLTDQSGKFFHEVKNNYAKGFKLGDYKTFLRHLKGYQEDALTKARTTGLKDLINHMNEELNYHITNIENIQNNKKRSQKEEIEFWNNHDKEVNTLKALKPHASREDKELITTLERMGIDKHEQLEDEYAKKQIGK